MFVRFWYNYAILGNRASKSIKQMFLMLFTAMFQSKDWIVSNILYDTKAMETFREEKLVESDRKKKNWLKIFQTSARITLITQTNDFSMIKVSESPRNRRKPIDKMNVQIMSLQNTLEAQLAINAHNGNPYRFSYAICWSIIRNNCSIDCYENNPSQRIFFFWSTWTFGSYLMHSSNVLYISKNQKHWERLSNSEWRATWREKGRSLSLKGLSSRDITVLPL